MKYYTLSQIYKLYGDCPKKEIVITTTPNKFKLVMMKDYWNTLDNNSCESGHCSDANGNIYDVVPDPKGKYQPFIIWRKL